MVNRSLVLSARAEGMRRWATDSEAALWRVLSRKQLGVEFRRQLVIGQCIADFAAPRERLVVEVDGAYHARRLAADARRDAKLARLGWRVLRLDAELVLRDLGAAVARVREALHE